jgi:threonine-phosphate decarboxylase
MPGHSDSLAHDFRAAVDGARLEPQLDREHGGDVDRWARHAGIEAHEILDFSASINPLGPPPSARRAFVNSYGEISRYPDPHGEELKEALAEHHGMNPAEVLIGNGSTQLIYLLCAALRPCKALIVGPAFSEYANALTLAGADIRQFTLGPDDGFQFSTERFMAAWEKGCNMVFLATPNSVTGQLIPKAEIGNIARLALARKSFLVVDEAFIDYVEGESVKTQARHNPYLIVLRSLTKYYALPGLRLGYLFGEACTVAQLAAYQEPWSVNAPALNVALACLEDESFTSKTERWLQRERKFLSQRMAALEGLHPLPSQSNFLLVKIDRSGGKAPPLGTFLLNKKILIRACDSFAGVGVDYFRIVVRRRKDNRRLLAALEEWTASSIG